MATSDPGITPAKNDPLLEELKAVLAQAQDLRFSSENLNVSDAAKSQNYDVVAKAASCIHSLGTKLREMITEDSRFPGTDVKWINKGNGAQGFYPKFAITPLINRAILSNSAEEAIEWMQRVLATESATSLSISALWGVPVDDEIELLDNVKIVPLDSIPDSFNKRWLMGLSNAFVGNAVYSPLNFTSPQSALVVSEKIKPFITGPEDEAPNSAEERFEERHKLINGITSILTIVGNRAVIPSSQWLTLEDSDLEQASIINGRGTPWIEILPQKERKEEVLNKLLAQEIVSGYFNLDKTTQGTVSTALHRLNKAIIRHNVGDSAVELSVALEALTGDGTTNEMTHKVKVRTVRLIGGSDEVRARNASILTNTYDIRSKMVHTGSVQTHKLKEIAGVKMLPDEIISEAINLCAELIRKIIRIGKIPKWPTFDITENKY